MKIHTKDGLIDIEELEIEDKITLEDNARVVATQWRRNGEIVRQDVHVSILRGHELNGAQGSM